MRGEKKEMNETHERKKAYKETRKVFKMNILFSVTSLQTNQEL